MFPLQPGYEWILRLSNQAQERGTTLKTHSNDPHSPWCYHVMNWCRTVHEKEILTSLPILTNTTMRRTHRNMYKARYYIHMNRLSLIFSRGGSREGKRVYFFMAFEKWGIWNHYNVIWANYNTEEHGRRKGKEQFTAVTEINPVNKSSIQFCFTEVISPAAECSSHSL